MSTMFTSISAVKEPDCLNVGGAICRRNRDLGVHSGPQDGAAALGDPCEDGEQVLALDNVGRKIRIGPNFNFEVLTGGLGF